MAKDRGFYRNADDEPLICADCGGMHIDSLEEIGLRWKTALDGYRILGWRSSIDGRGEMIPVGYGIAYYEPGRDRAVIMPMPFNLIVGAWRALRWWATCPPWRFVGMKLVKQTEFAWESGWRAARDDPSWIASHNFAIDHDKHLEAYRAFVSKHGIKNG